MPEKSIQERAKATLKWIPKEQQTNGLGMVEPYHYIFIAVDGRFSDSPGLKMDEFAQLFVEYGCKVAYNLDGGGSSTMYMHNKLVNRPCQGDERDISDIIYIGLE
jgi:exopolysaccharide biosynthesis protein